MAGFEAPGAANVPNWTEDGSSPHNLSSDGNQVALVDSYDEVMLRIVDRSGENTFFKMRVNSDSSDNYYYYKNDGSSTSLDTSFSLGVVRTGSGAIWLSGRWAEYLTARCLIGGDDSGQMTAGENLSVASPLNSVSFVDASGNPITADVDISVYGRNA